MSGHGRTARHRDRGPPGPRLTVWLAVLAVLAQAVLFEFAMAARETAAARERVAAAAHHEHHEHGAAPGAPERDRPEHRHGGPDCPFCLARAAHQLASLPTAASLPLPRAMGMAAAPRPPAPARPRRRPARFRARSPPRLRPTIAA